jgi:hypothetical protein
VSTPLRIEIFLVQHARIIDFHTGVLGFAVRRREGLRVTGRVPGGRAD